MNFEDNLNLPWLCIDDFNELLWPHEKQGGNEYKRRFLRDFMDAHDLSDLGFKRPAIHVEEQLGNCCWLYV